MKANINRSSDERSPSQKVEAIIAKLSDWRGEKLEQIRSLIKSADPDIIEEVKWKKPSNPDGIPVWSHDGIICTGETYKNHLRLTFMKGVLLKDSTSLFNTYRSIVINEGDKIDEVAFKDLIRAAVAINRNKRK